MKKLLAILAALMALGGVGLAQSTPPQTWTEQDGSPSVLSPTKIIFPNGALTVNGKQVTVASGGGGSGTVTTVSVVSANGLAGTVANATTTPAITLRTTITGLLKGNGTAISAASAGTDYVAPGAVTTSGLTMATSRLLGRTTASTGAIEELTAATATAFLNAFVGDSGSGGTKGLVPAPSTGDATKFLKGDGTWATPAGGGITVGTTTISSGTPGSIPYNNAGVYGETNLIYSSNVTTLTNNLAANTSGDGFVLTNTTAATSGNQRYSPRIRLTGQGFATVGSASQTIDYIIENQPQQGTSNPSGILFIKSSVNGGAYTTQLALSTSSTASLWMLGAQTASATNYVLSTDGANFLQVNGPAANNNGIRIQLAGVTRALLSVNSSVTSFQVGSADEIGFNSAANPTGAPDAKFSRGGAANIRMGAADAASPVAQTLSVQNVVAGTTDTAGANWTLAGSRGTGTGAGGDVIIQTAPAAAGTGNTQNALAAAFTVKGNGAVQLKSVTFTNLPTVANGYLIYCSDCTAGSSPCSSGGSGSIAMGQNSAWKCF